jgi:hypothetical protein
MRHAPTRTVDQSDLTSLASFRLLLKGSVCLLMHVKLPNLQVGLYRGLCRILPNLQFLLMPDVAAEQSRWGAHG